VSDTKSETPVTIETTHASTTNTTPDLDLPDLEFLSAATKSESRPELLVPPFPSRTSSSTSLSSDHFVEIPLNQSNQVSNDGSFSSLFSRVKRDGSSESDDDDLLFSSESEGEWSASDDVDRTVIPRDLPAVHIALPPVHDDDEW